MNTYSIKMSLLLFGVYISLKVSPHPSTVTPTKKTGLILLAGEATLSFLNDTIDMKPLSRQLLRPGLFHSTKATKGEAVLLEIETPPNKEDIVRFDDKYGRKGKPIETKTEPLPDDCPLLTNGIHVGSCDLWIAKKGDWIDQTAVIAILSGGMMAGKDMIVGPGDVGSFASYFKLGQSFKSKDIKLLVVCAHQPSA